MLLIHGSMVIDAHEQGLNPSSLRVPGSDRVQVRAPPSGGVHGLRLHQTGMMVSPPAAPDGEKPTTAAGSIDPALCASYRLPASHVAALIAGFVLVPAVVGELFFSVFVRRDIPYGNVIWLVIAAWNAYWFLWRFAYSAQVDQGMLRWRAPLHSGVFPVRQLRRIRPSRIFWNIEIMKVAGEGAVLIWAVKGFTGFASALAGQAAGLDLRLSRQARLAERLPVPSNFHARGPGVGTCDRTGR